MLKKIILAASVCLIAVTVQASEKLILVNSSTYDGMSQARQYIEGNGVWIKHIYPPSVLIVDEKNSDRLQNVRGIAGIYKDKIESSVIDSLKDSAKIGALVWNADIDNSKKAPAAPVVLPSYFFDGSDCLIPPDYKAPANKAPGFFAKVLPEPPTYLTTGYFIGSVAICLVFPQYSGTGTDVLTHTWSASEITTYTTTYKNELNKFITAEPNAHITYIWESNLLSQM